MDEVRDLGFWSRRNKVHEGDLVNVALYSNKNIFNVGIAPLNLCKIWSICKDLNIDKIWID